MDLVLPGPDPKVAICNASKKRYVYSNFKAQLFLVVLLLDVLVIVSGDGSSHGDNERD